MRANRRSLLIAIIFLQLCGAPTIFAQAEKVALVIGNSNYQYGELQNPVNDATDMAAALRELGFSVTLRINATQAEMEDSVDRLGAQLHPETVGLFYYAGHGVQVGHDNFLIPVSSSILSEADVRQRGVSLGRILDQMGTARNGLNIVILDACRNNPLRGNYRSASRGLARVDSPKGTLIAYATQPGGVAQDGDGRNSPYTKHLLEAMMKPGLQVELVFKDVLRNVHRVTAGKQTPWVETSFMGHFSFLEAIPANELQPPEGPGADEAAWNIIKDGNSVSDLDRFLQEFPDSPYGLAAKLKRGQILSLIPLSSSGAPPDGWRVVLESNFTEVGDSSIWRRTSLPWTENARYHSGGGRYMVSIRDSGTAWGVDSRIDYTDYDDFIFESRMRKVGGDFSPGYGLKWGNADWETYVFLVSGSGYFSILKSDGGTWVKVAARQNEAINKGLSENKLTVRKIGGNISFLINDIQVDQRSFSRFDEFMDGHFGFYVEGRQRVDFDHIRVMTRVSTVP